MSAELGRLRLHFRDRDLERAYREEFDLRHAGSNRLGIYLSIVAWVMAFTAAGAVYGDRIVRPLIIFAAILLPVFVLVLVVTRFPRLRLFFQPLTALANLLAGLMVIYGAFYLLGDLVLLAAGMTAVIFFSYFILRLRFILAAVVSLSYVFACTVTLLVMLPSESGARIVAGTGLMLAWFCGTVGGYYLERSVRTTFLLRHRLEEANRQLRQESYTDSLTDLYNRQFYFETLHSEIESVRRYGRDLSVALIDIDHFKRVNDSHGHPAGDIVLKEFAALIRQAVRKSDVPARYGGEEFVVLLRDATLADASTIMDRLRKTIENHPFPGLESRLTCSIRVASWREGLDAGALLGRADGNMYDAKKRGRNRVTAG